MRKVLHKNGQRTWETLPNIPRYGQAVEDIGQFTRRDLRPPSNLKAIFRDLRNHLAGNLTGITRDEALAAEIVNILFCKIYDELETDPYDIVRFRSGHAEPPDQVRKRILDLFEEVKVQYSDVFSEDDTIRLDSDNIVYVVGELQNYSVTEANRDSVGDAFEVFIGPALRGTEGQFFTPRNVVKMIVSMLNPGPGELLIDPACGSGGFLIMALEHVWMELEYQADIRGWSPLALDRRKRDAATKSFRGIDKDSFLAKVTKAYMAILGDGRGGVFCENSLQPPREWSYEANSKVELGKFSVVLTNPPFGSKIRVKGTALLNQYDLGHKWKKGSRKGTFTLTDELRADQMPQLLFVERCLQLLKTGGRLGIVLPESILGNPSYSYVLGWISKRAVVRAVVTLPEALFKTSGKGGTHTKVCVLMLEKGTTKEDYSIFMADARWCGHDSRGNPTLRRNEDGELILLDDVPTVAQNFAAYRTGNLDPQTRLGFTIRKSELVGGVLVPKYYDPELAAELEALSTSHELVRIGDLITKNVLTIATGIEVGKMAYGTGLIPFIRTSDLSNWELKADPKQGVSEEIYDLLKDTVDVQAGDILMVRDGTYLIGTCAMITSYDTKILYQSHIYKLRLDEKAKLDPYLFFAALNSPIVKRQVRSKQFTQDIIDTLGARLADLVLPIPRNAKRRKELAGATRTVVETRAAMRAESVRISTSVAGGNLEEVE